MTAIKELREAFGRAQGPLPYYSLSHAVLLLLSLEKSALGRKRISSIMMLGEGSVRSLLGKLRELGWIQCGREGCALTELGARKVSELRKCLLGPIEIELKELIRGSAHATLVKCVNYLSVLELRDEAVRCGGKGAIILRKTEGVLTFPETGESLLSYAPGDNEILERYLNPQEGDLVIIGIANDPRTSRLSSIAPSLLVIWDP